MRNGCHFQELKLKVFSTLPPQNSRPWSLHHWKMVTFFLDPRLQVTTATVYM